jgi:hypothetical protein
MFYTIVTEPNLMKRLFLFLALILSISRISFAQEVTLRIHTIAAAGQDSPVRVVQLMLWPNPPDSYSPAVIGVMVHNFSDKKVVSARIESWLRAPGGCTAQPASFSGGGGGTESVYLEPGAEARLWSFPADPHIAVSAGVWTRSTFIQVQIGVGAVNFSDGTSWHLTNNKALDPGQLESDSESCRDWAWPQNLNSASMGRWDELGTRPLRGIGRLQLYRLPQRTTATPSPDSPEWATRENIPTDSYYYDCTVELDARRGFCGRPQIFPASRPHRAGSVDPLDF